MIRKDVNNSDRRVIKTKKAIRNAFTELLSKYDINEITITEIARVAQVNRKTIYNYYDGVYQILDEVENECVRNYERIARTLPTPTNPEAVFKTFEAVTKILNEDIEFYSKLVNVKNNSQIVNKIYSAVIDRLKDDLLNLNLIEPSKAELIAKYITTGMVSCYIYWFRKEPKESLEEFSRDVSKLVLNGIAPFLK